MVSVKKAKIVSDYTPLEQPNELIIMRDDQGDIHINMIQKSESERGIRVAVSGTRYSHKVREALYDLVDALRSERRSLEDMRDGF